MSDRELLELAALAAGYEVIWGEQWGAYFRAGKFLAESSRSFWTPLTDDGDTLRLAVTLKLRIMPQEKCVYVESNPDTMLGFAGVSVLEMYGTAPCAATRRAITRAAAEIGKQMKEQTP